MVRATRHTHTLTLAVPNSIPLQDLEDAEIYANGSWDIKTRSRCL